MMSTTYRKALVFAFLTVALLASVLYDTLIVQESEVLQLPLAAVMAGSFAAVFVLERYPVHVLKSVVFASWPLHVFTLSFFWMCLAYHGGTPMDQVIFYTLFAYATYVMVPMVLLLDRRILVAFMKLVAALGALLAIPSVFGALGFQSFLGIPLRLKYSYAEFSGIIASAGVFEHAEGHAFQMAIGIACSLFALRVGGRIPFYLACFMLNLTGLVISQGRAAIYGAMVALTFSLLPELFRRSRPVFIGTLALLWTFPFLILPQLAALPGVGGYLRIERGMSGRGEAWRLAFAAIGERPWTGHGFMASSELTEAEKKTLRKSGFSGAGTTFHNTFISKAVDLGLIATFLYALLYLLPLQRICTPSRYPHEHELVRNMLLLTLTAAIFRDYNIGGIRSTAMLGTIFLGLGNLWGLVAWWGRSGSAEAEATETPRETISPVAAALHVRSMPSIRSSH